MRILLSRKANSIIGTTDEKGVVRIENIDVGNYEIRFADFDQNSLEEVT